MRRVLASQLVDSPPLPSPSGARVVAPFLYPKRTAIPGANHSDGAAFTRRTQWIGEAGRGPGVAHPVSGRLQTPTLPASMAPLTALVNSLGGLPHQTALLHSWILVLHPDFLLLQETREPDAVKAALPDHHGTHVSQVSGPGAGCVIARRRAHVPASDHTVLRNCIDWLAVPLPLASHGCTPAVSVLFRPKLSSAAQRRHLQRIATLEFTSKPTRLHLGGDFNSAVAQGTALHAALSPRGCLGHAQLLLPDGTLSNLSRSGPILTPTAIDHVFVSGAVSEAKVVAFPMESADMAILATVQLSSTAVDMFAWKQYCWRALQPEGLERVVSVLDIYTAFLALTPVAPDMYIAPAHAVAEWELASLAPHPPRYSPERIHALQVSQRARQRLYRSRADTLRTAAITGATR